MPLIKKALLELLRHPLKHMNSASFIELDGYLQGCLDAIKFGYVEGTPGYESNYRMAMDTAIRKACIQGHRTAGFYLSVMLVARFNDKDAFGKFKEIYLGYIQDGRDETLDCLERGPWYEIPGKKPSGKRPVSLEHYIQTIARHPIAPRHGIRTFTAMVRGFIFFCKANAIPCDEKHYLNFDRWVAIQSNLRDKRFQGWEAVLFYNSMNEGNALNDYVKLYHAWRDGQKR